MTQSTIDTDQELITLINVFTVTPNSQQKLIDLLVAATEEVIQHQPGFISANIHASLDGSKVVNYAQWRSPADFEAMLANPAAQEHMGPAYALATVEPNLYTVASIHHI